MNRLGVHALVWTGGWSEAESRHAIARSKAAGYDYIEIALLDPASVDPVTTKRLFTEYDLAATCSSDSRSMQIFRATIRTSPRAVKRS